MSAADMAPDEPTPLDLAIRRLNADLSSYEGWRAAAEKSGTRRPFTDRVLDIVTALDGVEFWDDDPDSTFFTPLGDLVRGVATAVHVCVYELRDLHTDVAALRLDTEKLQNRVNQLEQSQSVCRVYGGWASRFRIMLAQQMGTTWGALSEGLGAEEDMAEEDAWAEGPLHQTLESALAEVGMSKEEWGQLGAFAPRLNSFSHDSEWPAAKTRQQKSAMAKKYLVMLDNLDAEWLHIRPCMSKAIRAVAKARGWAV